MPKCPVCRDTGFSQASRYATKETCLCQFTAPAPQPVADAVSLARISRPTASSVEYRRLESLATDLDSHDETIIAAAVAGAMSGRCPTPDSITNAARDIRSAAKLLASHCARLYADEAFPHNGDMCMESGIITEAMNALGVACSILRRCDEEATP